MVVIKDEDKIEATIDNSLELKQTFVKVHTDIKDSIKEDFAIAYLEGKDKEFVIEMTGNAYYGKKLIEITKEKGGEWEYNKEEKQWEKRTYKNKIKTNIMKQANRMFNNYMIKVYMIVLVERNKKNNPLLKYILEAKDDETEEEDKKLLETIKANALKVENK